MPFLHTPSTSGGAFSPIIQRNDNFTHALRERRNAILFWCWIGGIKAALLLRMRLVPQSTITVTSRYNQQRMYYQSMQLDQQIIQGDSKNPFIAFWGETRTG
jgi:hypothetical protein